MIVFAALPTEMERGEAFEEFCKPFFILDPVFQFKEVYRQKEIPYSVKQRLGYQVNQDIRIDGLCVTFDDKLFAYQAKFRSDRSKALNCLGVPQNGLTNGSFCAY